jgi:hypothetical protein
MRTFNSSIGTFARCLSSCRCMLRQICYSDRPTRRADIIRAFRLVRQLCRLVAAEAPSVVPYTADEFRRVLVSRRAFVSNFTTTAEHGLAFVRAMAAYVHEVKAVLQRRNANPRARRRRNKHVCAR